MPQQIPSSTPTLAFIGAGNMAQAIIRGLLASGYPAARIIATGRTQAKLDQLHQTTQVTISTNNHHAAAQADVVILGVKPQMMAELVKDLTGVLDSKRQLIISLAAGIRATSIAQWIGQTYAIIRCMSNTPALIGKGASGLFANAQVSDQQKDIAEHIVNAVGISIWLEDEKQIDAVTAVSGSGPAYYFLMMEAMIAAAQELGLSPNQADVLVKQTALGAATMVQSDGATPAQLRAAVTSPKGTTEQALNSFVEDDYQAIITKAMSMAYKRSQELAEMFK